MAARSIIYIQRLKIQWSLLPGPLYAQSIAKHFLLQNDSDIYPNTPYTFL